VIGRLGFWSSALILAQAIPYPAGDRAPTLEETRAGMGIPSTDKLRGQRDAVGYASKADQMLKVWDLSAEGPAPERLGPAPRAGVIAALAPHDDYLYAGRVYRGVLPLVTAKTVIVIGVFHQYRKYRVRDRIVFDPYEAWHAPDGAVPVSPLREDLVAAMPPPTTPSTRSRRRCSGCGMPTPRSRSCPFSLPRRTSRGSKRSRAVSETPWRPR